MQQIRPRRILETNLLSAAAVFTSASINGEKYGRLTGKVFSDQSGTLTIEHADDDGTNNPLSWDELTSISVTGGTASKFDEPLYCKFVRVVYTNGATDQTVFRLSAYLGQRGD